MSNKEMIMFIFTCLFFYGAVYYECTKPENNLKPTKEYQRGFNSGMDCLALTNLEKMLKNESRTFEELMNICRERHKIEEN